MTLQRHAVYLTAEAGEDLLRLTHHLINRAQDLEDLSRVESTILHLWQAIDVQLAHSPWSFRKAGAGGRTTRRELVVPAGATGYVALFEIEPGNRVQVLAVRHHLEQDYH